MKNLKQKQLTKTIQMYTHTHTANKARQPLVARNFSKCQQSVSEPLDHKSKILAQKYSQLIQHLESYRKRIHQTLEHQLIKNQNHYLQMNKIIQKSRIQSRDWLRQKACHTNDLIDDKMLVLQTKFYQIMKNQNKSIQQQLAQYQEMKILDLPIFQVQNLNMQQFQKDIKKYCIHCEQQPQQSFEGLFAKKTRIKTINKQQLPQVKAETIKKQTKYVYDYDLLCEEEMNWDEEKQKQNLKNHYLFHDVIVEQSESQEDSIIYNTEFS